MEPLTKSNYLKTIKLKILPKPPRKLKKHWKKYLIKKLRETGSPYKKLYWHKYFGWTTVK